VSTRSSPCLVCTFLAYALIACGSRTELDVSPAPLAYDTGHDAGATVDAFVKHDAVTIPDAPAKRDAVGLPDASSPVDSGGLCNDGGLLAVAYVLGDDGVIYRYDPVKATYTALGSPDCANSNVQWTMTASLDHAYIVYTDWTIYAVDVTTLECSPTAFQSGQLGLDFEFGVAVAGSGASETLYVYGVPDGAENPILAKCDTSSFVLTKVGDIVPIPSSDSFPLNLSADSMGRLYGFSQNGLLQQIDSATGIVITSFQTGIETSTWAGLTYGPDLFLFAGTELYGFDANLQPISSVDGGVSPVGAGSAVLCNPSATP